MHYLIKLGDATSQWFNVILFNGDPNYSISGDSYRFNREFLRCFIDFLFSPFEKDHCEKAYKNDLNKAIKLVQEEGLM